MTPLKDQIKQRHINNKVAKKEENKSINRLLEKTMNKR